jgi:hypothetical protein
MKHLLKKKKMKEKSYCIARISETSNGDSASYKNQLKINVSRVNQ